MGEQKLNSDNQEKPSLLTIPDVAARLKASKRTVSRIIKSGELESIKIRGCRRILPESYDAFIESKRSSR